MITLFEFEDLICDYVEHPDFGNGIIDQLMGEYEFEGINFGHVQWEFYRCKKEAS